MDLLVCRLFPGWGHFSKPCPCLLISCDVKNSTEGFFEEHTSLESTRLPSRSARSLYFPFKRFVFSYCFFLVFIKESLPRVSLFLRPKVLLFDYFQSISFLHDVSHCHVDLHFFFFYSSPLCWQLVSFGSLGNR